MQVPVNMGGTTMRSTGGAASTSGFGGAASIFEWQTPVVTGRQAMAGQSLMHFWQLAAFHLARTASSSTLELTQTLQPEQPSEVAEVIWHCSLSIGLQTRARLSAAANSLSYMLQMPLAPQASAPESGP